MSPEEKENQLYQQIDAVCNRLIYWKEKYIKLAELCAENKCKCQETLIEKQARLQREGLGL